MVPSRLMVSQVLLTAVRSGTVSRTIPHFAKRSKKTDPPHFLFQFPLLVVPEDRKP